MSIASPSLVEHARERLEMQIEAYAFLEQKLLLLRGWVWGKTCAILESQEPVSLDDQYSHTHHVARSALIEALQYFPDLPAQDRRPFPDIVIDCGDFQVDKIARLCIQQLPAFDAGHVISWDDMQEAWTRLWDDRPRLLQVLGANN